MTRNRFFGVSSANQVTGEIAEPLTSARIREAAERLGVSIKVDNAALEKSRDLLLANLNEEQRRSFILRKYFDIISRAHPFRLWEDITERLTDGTRYCVVFPGLPIYDQILARKLFLECDPEEFFRVANVFPPRGRGTARDEVRIDEYFRRWSQFLLAQLARRYDIRPADLYLEVTACDFANAFEFRVLLYRSFSRVFRVDRYHFLANGFQEVVEPHLRAVVADLLKEARAEYERNRIEYLPLLGRGVLGDDDEPLW